MGSTPSYVLEFAYRADNGPRLVGPFPSRSAAEDYLDRLGIDYEANAAPLSPPEVRPMRSAPCGQCGTDPLDATGTPGELSLPTRDRAGP